ncbi:hypothetical protein Pmar_PMAR021941 [Perkinsus marinus ATCC 50983]|uniref:Uncharacterized protein n=1 Tax=Perkinsus marinus (strain ATCC 50983 / TXsc) TaxID=423536 RepID=C5LVY0_PERM5|nr:hypothetical protein Pmar_PMAR021941 [Perkinsus marinus ATCC 50983]EEQ99112.1 hypothetical protein Pmar_PMAR021941 [Perkinsus marinus ATCC 50983]|eukprot:XP_002766395.1 hypothetical protein Pmar_PMAR021941 [Perkinsus marinus ATCC 50983]
MPANNQETSAVDTVLTNIAQASPAAVRHLDAIKKAVNEFGLSTLMLFAAADGTAVNKIAAKVSPGTTNEAESAASLVRGVLSAAIKNANAQMEILQLRDAQVERVRKTPALDLTKVCSEAQKAKSSFKVLPNTLPPAIVVKKVLDQPFAYYDLGEFMFPSHVFDNDLETITTITGEVVQPRRSDGKKEPIRNIGQWCECFVRYAVTLQLSDRGRKEVDFGTLFSYLAHVCAAFEVHPYQAVIQAEAKYRRTGAMAVASGVITMEKLFGEETYLRPRLDMEIGSVLNNRDYSPGKGKGFGKAKGKGSNWSSAPFRGKGKGQGKGKGHRSQPYDNTNAPSSEPPTMSSSN